MVGLAIVAGNHPVASAPDSSVVDTPVHRGMLFGAVQLGMRRVLLPLRPVLVVIIQRDT